MSTRSTIALKVDNTYESIYCHFDGYPQHHLPILQNHYNTKEKVQQLINLGDLSILGSEIGEKHNFDNHSKHPEFRNLCLAYGRDRDEKNVDKRTNSTKGDLITQAHNNDSDYLYIFEDDKWSVMNMLDLMSPWRKNDTVNNNRTKSDKESL